MRSAGIIASLTLTELLRSRSIIGVVVFAAFLLGVATLFGSVSVGDKVKVIGDFGLFLVSLASIAFAIAGGTSLLAKELSRKTIYNILSKPVERWEFVTGKFLGMFGAASLVVVILIPSLMIYEWWWSNSIKWSFIVSALAMLLELLIVCSAALFFSSIVVTPSLAGILTIGLFLVGRNASSLIDLAQSLGSESWLGTFLVILYWVLPHLDAIHINNELVYGILPSGSHMVWSAVYAISYSAMLITLGSFLFKKREFN